VLQGAHVTAAATGHDHHRVLAGGGDVCARGGVRRAGLARSDGRSRGDSGQGADGQALGARTAGHELNLSGAATGARAPGRQLPMLWIGQIATAACGAGSARGGRGCGAFVMSGRGRRGEGHRRRCAVAASPRALQRGFPQLTGSEIARRSRHVLVPSVAQGAYGVSCRARADCATPLARRLAPGNRLRLPVVPPLLPPEGKEDSARTVGQGSRCERCPASILAGDGAENPGSSERFSPEPAWHGGGPRAGSRARPRPPRRPGRGY
jgi:hypothetical protein